MKQAAKEAFEKKMHHQDTMKTIAEAYLGNRECSIQESVDHTLPELKLRRIFPAVYFVNSNLPEERVRVLLSKKELRANYQIIAQIFSRNRILIVIYNAISKTLLYHSRP